MRSEQRPFRAAGEPRYVRHKLRVPRRGTISRAGLVAQAADADIVVLTAGTGYGKTTIAVELAEATDGPTAWFSVDERDANPEIFGGYLLEALEQAWPDAPREPVTQNSVEQIRYAVDELTGPGCIVVDNVHAVPTETSGSILSALIEALPPRVVLVLASERHPPVDLLSEYASGRAVEIGSHDLCFDADEVAPFLGSRTEEVLGETGGWPIAVGLAGEQPPGHVIARDHESALAEPALGELDRRSIDHLTLLAALPAFPVSLLDALPEQDTNDIAAFRAAHPSLLVTAEDGWLTMSGLLRRQLATRAIDVDPASLVDRLRPHDPLLALRLLAATGRWEAANHLAYEVGIGYDLAGDVDMVRQVLAEVPPDRRTAVLRLFDAETRLSLHAVDTDELERIWHELRSIGSSVRFHAASVLANQVLFDGDAMRATAVATSALTDLMGAPVEPYVVGSAIERLPAPRQVDLSNLSGIVGTLLLLLGRAEDRANGREFLDIACRSIEAAGAPAEPRRAAGYAAEALAGSIEPVTAIPMIERGVACLRALGRRELGLMIVFLARVRRLAGDARGALRACAEAEELGAARGSEWLRVEAHTVGLLAAFGSAQTLSASIEACEAWWPRLLDHRRPLGVEFATSVGHLILDRDPAVDASLWLARAREVESRGAYRDIWLRILEARIEGDVDALEHHLSHFETQGCSTLADHVRGYVECLHGRDPGPPSPNSPPSTMHFSFLSTHVEVACGEDRILPSGHGARVLTMLASEGGAVESERLIDAIWPDADVDAGLNRLYLVLSRLRKSLGIVENDVLYSRDGVIYLNRDACISVDVWDFARALADERWADAVLTYTGDLCAGQFAYDDFAIETRRHLRADLEDAAVRALTARTGSDSLRIAQHVADLEPESDELVLECIAALSENRATARATALLESRLEQLRDLGIPDDELRDRGRRILDTSAEQV